MPEDSRQDVRELPDAPIRRSVCDSRRATIGEEQSSSDLSSVSGGLRLPLPKMDAKRKRKIKSVAKVMFIFWFGFPAAVMLWAVPMGAILAAVESAKFEDGFYFLGSVMSTSIAGLTSLVPSSDGGRFFVLMASSWGLGLFAVGSALLSAPVSEPLLNLLSLNDPGETFISETAGDSKNNALMKLLFLIFVAIPSVVLSVCIVISGPMAICEGSSYIDVFRYLLNVISGFNDSPSFTPNTSGGKFFSFVVASWSLAIRAFLIASVTQPFTNPLLKTLISNSSKLRVDE